MKERLTRRELLRFAGLGSMVALLASCAPKVVEVTKIVKEVVKETVIVAGTPQVVEKEITRIVKVEAPKEVGEVVNLRYQMRGSGNLELWTHFLTYFHDKYPNIRVETVPHPGGSDQGIKESLIAGMVAGDAPDVWRMCLWVSVWFVQQGLALNLQPYIDRDAEEIKMEEFCRQQFDAWTMEGDKYGMPFYTSSLCIYYNKDMFNEEGVAHPSSEWGEFPFEDYRAMCDKFVRREEPMRWGSTNYGLNGGWLAQYWLRGFGINMVNPEDNTECQLCDPKAQECLEIMRQMISEDHSFAQGPETGGMGVDALMGGERCAMLEIGSWQLDEAAEQFDFEWDLAPMWNGPGGITTHQGAEGTFVWSEAPHPEEAWKLSMELAGPEFETFMILYDPLQPSRKSLLPLWIAELRKRYPYLEKVNVEVLAEVVQNDYGRQEEYFRYDTASKRQILDPVIEKVIVFNEAPVSLICKAAEIVTRLNRDEISIEEIGAELGKIM